MGPIFRIAACRAALMPVLLALVLAGCSASGSDPEESPVGVNDPDVLRYVSLGDSYTSAPGIAGGDTSEGCLRSQNNYPALVAAGIEADEHVDVSCSGAMTIHMTRTREVGDVKHPPQFDALTPDTDLVTVSIGANDFALFSRMFWGCGALAKQNPQGSPCAEKQSERGYDLAAVQTDRIRERVELTVYGIRDRAPNAEIVVLGYPQLVPPQGYCPTRLPLARGDYRYVKQTLTTLSIEVAKGASEAGAEFVDLIKASDGHDVCSKKPWINGVIEEPDRAAPYHPYPAQQRAAANLILERLKSQDVDLA